MILIRIRKKHSLLGSAPLHKLTSFHGDNPERMYRWFQALWLLLLWAQHGQSGIVHPTITQAGQRLGVVHLPRGGTSRNEEEPVSEPGNTKRRSSDFLLHLFRDKKDESLSLRQLITSRSSEYLDALNSKPPHPIKLLHFLAPKIPAIKQSPDVNLRIHAAKSDIDAGVAACIIGTLANVCEVMGEDGSTSSEITADRRFEQLVECILSGVDVEKRVQEHLGRKLDKQDEGMEDIEPFLDRKDFKEDEGLDVRDCCRAAWGIAVLGAHRLNTFGDVQVLDLILALSLRVRELLLARLQRLRQGDLFVGPSSAHLSPEELLDRSADVLTQDTASAMWTFACVRACTGRRSDDLFEVCCSILRQDPTALRKRAQEADIETGHGGEVGANDVIDRLARSEEEAAEPPNVTRADSNSTELQKTFLLDWLTPAEATDVLWALAVHGASNSTETSESASTSSLRELVVSKVTEWLEGDLLVSKATIPVPEPEVAKPTQIEVAPPSADETGTASKSSDAMSQAEAAAETSVQKEDLREVQVVDAAALLASAEGDDSVAVETEVMLAPTQHSEPDDDAASQELAGKKDDMSSSEVVSTTIHSRFSIHDLASIAWSVTETRDSMRSRAVAIVIELVARLGESGPTRLCCSDLANLAWAVAKFEGETSDKGAPPPRSYSVSIVSWIAHSVMSDLAENGDPEKRILRAFQPPEIGRLLWAMGNVLSSFSHTPEDIGSNDKIHELAKVALVAAASNIPLFSTEDLVRVCWAYLELCGSEASPRDPSVAIALGSILCTLEKSLHQWERGEDGIPLSGDSGPPSVAAQGTLFSSFFGRPKLNQPLLEQPLFEHEDEDEIGLAPLFKKSRRPVLRDLAVDPATLCRIVSAFQRAALYHPEIKGGWMLTRVVLRLLCSKGARLLRECSIHDIVRLSEAAVSCGREGHSRELVTGLFGHKVIQVLNDALEDAEMSSTIHVQTASPSEVATLIWALGLLGAKHSLVEEDRQVAYKRRHLVSVEQLLSKEQVSTLDASSVIRLLHGMVLMKYSTSDPMFLLQVLKQTQAVVSKVEDGGQMCELVETLAMLREETRLGSTFVDPVRDTTAGTSVEADTEVAADLAAPPIDAFSVGAELSFVSNQVLASVTRQALERVGALTAEQIRRLLSVYSLLPFQSDDLINRLDVEVSKRLSMLREVSDGSLDRLVREAESQMETAVQETSETPFTSEGNARVEGDTSSDGVQDTNSLTVSASKLMRDSLAKLSEAGSKIKKVQSALGSSLDTVAKRASEGALFELGRCQELIANYRRVDFHTGTRRSRYDEEGRKDVAKRVLSRLLP